MIKNITLSADEKLIYKARLKALKAKKSLNVVFREWLAQYIMRDTAIDYKTVMKKLKHIESGRHFSRDEMNER